VTNKLRLKLLSTCRSFIESFNDSIKKKMILLMILLTCAPLIVITIVAINNAHSQLESEIVVSNKSKIYWSGLFLDDQLQILNNILFSIMADREITNYMENDEIGDDSVRYAIQTYILDKISSLYFPNINMFDEIMLFKQQSGRTYSLRNGQSRINTNENINMPWSQLGTNKLTFMMNGKQETNFLIIRTFFRFIDHKVMGGVSLDVKWSMFNQIFASLKSEEINTIFILDEQGNVVHQPFTDVIIPDNIHTFFADMQMNVNKNYIKTDTHYVFFQSFGEGRMYLVKMIPTSVVSDSSRNTLLFSILIIIGLITVSVTASILMANKVTAPILKLVRAIRWTEETNSELYIARSRKDEIGVLERKYAEMVHTHYQTYIEKRTAQLKALQAQINPHFLHNTLQSIGAMAVTRKVPEIYSIIQAVSKNFRYTMTQGNDLVTLQEELEHVDNYLLIQKFRFKDKVEVEINVEHGIESCLLPPLTLQPIVENAFEHGFAQKKGKWLIQINVEACGDKVKIVIEDNGVGFSQERKLEIMESLSTDVANIIDYTESMALANIHARLKSHFGPTYGLEIYSIEQQVTRVSITLPYY
jgi:two-component system sensor histidine kinase YesM